ncbi:MAG: lipopolysaccharide biosynthesis protein [Chloroflexi bacterium]|nr:MAG: lipopolysaccharide biosynthesis protein [Chloroflexota bacterium]
MAHILQHLSSSTRLAPAQRTLVGDVARYAPGLAVPIIAGTLSTIIFARLATPEELGTFLLILASATTLGVPFGYWLQQAVLRLYPAYAETGRTRSFEQAVSVLGLLAALACSAVFAVLLGLGLGGVRSVPGLFAPALALAFFPVASSGRSAMLQARYALGRYATLNVLAALGKLGLPLVLLLWLPPVAALLWGTAVALGAVWLVLVLQRADGSTEQGLSSLELRHIARESLTYGAPLTLSEVGAQILSYSDRWTIGLLLGPAAVGLYSTNYSIAEKLVILVQAPLIYAAHSQIVTAWESKAPDRTRHLIAVATRWLALVGVPLVAFTAVRGEMLSALLLGETFASGHVIIPIAAGSILLYAASQYGHKSFELSRSTWVITMTLSGAALVNLVAVVALTLAFGYVGGAWATALGYAVYGAATFIVTRHRGPFAWRVPWMTVCRAVVGAGVASTVWIALVPPRVFDVRALLAMFGGGVAGLVVYAVVLLALGELPHPQFASSISRYRRSWARAWASTEKTL